MKIWLFTSDEWIEEAMAFSTREKAINELKWRFENCVPMSEGYFEQNFETVSEIPTSGNFSWVCFDNGTRWSIYEVELDIMVIPHQQNKNF